MVSVSKNHTHSDESRAGTSTSNSANTIFPPYVNLRGISMDDEESQFSKSPKRSTHVMCVQDEYDFLDDSLPCLPSTSSGIGRVANNRRRYTSDSEDGGLDSESTVSEIRFRHPKRQVGTAYFDYVAKEQDELSLKRGSVVEIIQKDCDEDGWMLAKVDNKKGMVPKNYIGLVGCQPKVIEGSEIQRSTESIGRGGFANVFQGTFKGKTVALKIPRPQPTSLKADTIKVQAKVREALEREALIFCRLDHTNIVDFYGICLDPLLLVLELCEGGTLFSLCRKMVCSDALTTIYWAKQVASAMDHLHSREDPLVHADLKADNVLIKERSCECGLVDESWKDDSRYNPSGTCKTCGGVRLNLLTLKITDFGLSRNLSTKRDSFGGSVSWMPPEVIEKNDYSKQSDVWSFAVFLWEVLSCQAPFSNYDFHVVMYAVVRKEKTLHVPENCPMELRDVFSQCWKRDTKKRPSFSQILQLLEVAEKKIDNSYKWNIKEENQKRSAKSSQITLDEIKSQIEDGTIKVSAEEIVQRFSKPPVPDVKSRKNRGKKAKVNKESIGAPSDFRHNVSVRPSSESPPPAGRSGSQGKLFKVKYAEPPPSFKLQPASTPILHSSHSAIQNATISHSQANICSDQLPPSNNCTTLPRNYKHLTIKSPKPESLSGSSIDKRPNSRNKVLSKHINCTQKCCSPLLKYSHLAPFQFNGPPKPSKSNPELVNCGIVNTSQTQLTNRPHSKTSPNCPRITRNNHDYVALDGRNFGSDEESFHRHYRERQRSSIDTVLSTEEEKMTQKPFVAHTLGRTNAFRRKLMNSSPRGSVYPVDGDSAKASLSSSNSSNSREGEQINNGRAKNQDNNKDHVVTLPNTMLNTPTKTPSKTPACSFTGPGRPSIDGGCSRSRKSSSNTVQSTFYVDYDRQDSCASEHSQESEGPGSATSRRRSGSKKFTHILSRPFSKMFNGGHSQNTRNSSSPAQNRRNCSCGSMDGPCGCADAPVVECAVCHHPHHSHGENTQAYACLHDYMEYPLQLAPEMPYIEFVLSESWCSPSSSSDRIFSTVAQRHHVNQHTPNIKTYVKRGDYPDHQRQRHRTESAAGVVIPANSNALTPTSCCSASTSANSAVAFRVSPNTGRRHTANSPASSNAAPVTSGLVVKNSSPSAAHQHLSMNTVIPSQPQAITTINGPSIQSQSLTLSRTIGITQSYTDLHRNLPTPDASYSTLSPPNDILHSRSRSSDNPVEAAGSSGMPLSKSARAEIPAKVLAERINNKPVPSGPVVNRSYVHMPSSIYQKHQQRHQPSNYSPPPAQVPPLPLRRPTVGTPTSVSTTPTGVVDRPTPLPRSIPPSPPRDQAQEHPWPTSNAPVLNNAELEKKEPKSVQRRPNTLNLGVSVNSQIGRSQSSYSTQSGREGDSGLCTADSNVQLNNQQHNYCQQSSASEAPSPESSSISSQGEHPQGRKPASNTTTTNNSSATNSSPSPTSSVTSSPYIMLSDSSSLPVLNRLKPQQKDAEDELYSQVLPRSQAPKLSDTIEKLASTPPKPMTTTTIKNGRVATATKRVATTPSAIVNGVLGDIRLDRNLVVQATKVPKIPTNIKYNSNARPAPPKLPPPSSPSVPQ